MIRKNAAIDKLASAVKSLLWLKGQKADDVKALEDTYFDKCKATIKNDFE